MMARKILTILTLCLFVATVSPAQVSMKTYVILGQGQGAGSTAFAASLGSSVIARYDEIGVVVAQSSDPNFAAQAAALPGVGQVAEDPDRQWLDPNEQAIPLSDYAIDDSAVPSPDASSLPPANAETFSAAQWNLHQIHSDQT